jgi:hypothetical protein
VLSEDGGMVTRAGEKFLTDFGVHLEDVKRGRRTFCRPCVDWSERRLHLAGALGAALAGRCLELGWVARIRNSRALKISADGESGFRELFGIALRAEESPLLRRAGLSRSAARSRAFPLIPLTRVTHFRVTHFTITDSCPHHLMLALLRTRLSSAQSIAIGG